MNKKKQFEKQVKGMLKRYEESGYSMRTLNKFLDNKKPEEYMKSAKGVNEFKKRIKRARERKSILEEVRQINKRMKEDKYERALTGRFGKLFKQARDEVKSQNKTLEKVLGRKNAILAKTTLSDRFIQYDDLTKLKTEEQLVERIYQIHANPLIEEMKRVTNEDMKEFLHKYFTQIIDIHGMDKRIDKLADYFGSDYEKALKFINYVTAPQFTGEYDSDQGREDPMSFQDEMKNRLDRMEVVINQRQFKVRGKNR